MSVPSFLGIMVLGPGIILAPRESHSSLGHFWSSVPTFLLTFKKCRVFPPRLFNQYPQPFSPNLLYVNGRAVGLSPSLPRCIAWQWTSPSPWVPQTLGISFSCGSRADVMLVALQIAEESALLCQSLSWEQRRNQAQYEPSRPPASSEIGEVNEEGVAWGMKTRTGTPWALPDATSPQFISGLPEHTLLPPGMSFLCHQILFIL